MTRADVVFTFSVETLDDAVAREFSRPPDQTLLALARDERVGRMLAADGWRSLLISIARRRRFRLTEEVTIAGRNVVRVRPHRLRRGDSTEPATVEAAYRAYARTLGRAVAQSQGTSAPLPESATLVTYHPFVAAFCEAPWIRKVVFVAQDDWATGDGVRPWWALYRDAYARIEDRKAAIFAVSAELADRISPRAKVVPNGVSPEIWSPPRSVPVSIAALPRPRAIYTGTIDDRLNRELVEQTAVTVGSFVFIGIPGDIETIRWLRTVPNVVVLPAVGQHELAATVQACDVGVIPHRDDDLCVRAMSPLKLYEYLAAGLPAVSVDLPPIRGVDRTVYTCRPEDWAPTLRHALAVGRTPECQRLRFIRSASWETRMRPVVDAAVS